MLADPVVLVTPLCCGGADVRKAIAGHVLGEAKITGLYTLNPKVRL